MREQPDVRYRAIDGTLVFVDISGFTNLTERLAALPGVTSAGAVMYLPLRVSILSFRIGVNGFEIQGRPPVFRVSKVENYTKQQNSLLARRITGTFDVPCYIYTPACLPGGGFLILECAGKAQRRRRFALE